MSHVEERRIIPPDDLEVFDRRKPPPVVEPWVTRSKAGFFVYNRAAYELLNKPSGVEYLYSPKTGILGFRAADPDAPHAYSVYPQGNSKNFQSAAHAFNRFYGLSVDQTLRYKAELIGDTLYIDLNDKEALPVSRKKPKG